MSETFQLQFGTYLFPNKSFTLLDHRMDIDTPIMDVRRRDGGTFEKGYLKTKRWRLNGKVYGENLDSVHAVLDNMHFSLHNAGVAASFFYRADRYAWAQLAPGGLVLQQEHPGLYGYVWGADIILVSEPFVEGVTLNAITGLRTNNEATAQAVVSGSFPSSPIFQFIGGTWNTSDDIDVENEENAKTFRIVGGLLAGQTLLVDFAHGCVLKHVGAEMIDAMCYFAGDMDFVLKPGMTNDLVISGPTLAFTASWHDRWYL